MYKTLIRSNKIKRFFRVLLRDEIDYFFILLRKDFIIFKNFNSFRDAFRSGA